MTIKGYCQPLSAAPGEEIGFFVSTTATSFTVAIRDMSRHMLLLNTSGLVSSTLPGVNQPVPQTPVGATRKGCAWNQSFTRAAVNGCGWSESFRLRVPADWPSGMYTAVCEENGNTEYITFVVKPDPANRSQISVLANVNTWNAYNQWNGSDPLNGYSFYETEKTGGASVLSFERPNEPGLGPRNTTPAERGNSIEHTAGAEAWFLTWLAGPRDNPRSFDLYTDIDFHQSGEWFNEYLVLILQTHPEYWTELMYDRLKSFLHSGGSLLYLGGNGVYERVEYDSTFTKMFGRPWGPSLDSDAGRWFMRDQGLSELEILGVSFDNSYSNCFTDHIDGNSVYYFWPLTSKWPPPLTEVHEMLKGVTGSNTGGTNGNWYFGGPGKGANGDPSGWEWDKSFPLHGHKPPEGLEVIAIGGQGARVGTSIPQGQIDGAHMTYYRHPGGGFVFSASSLSFCGCVPFDRDLQRIVNNGLRLAGAIPVPEHEPFA